MLVLRVPVHVRFGCVARAVHQVGDLPPTGNEGITASQGENRAVLSLCFSAFCFTRRWVWGLCVAGRQGDTGSLWAPSLGGLFGSLTGARCFRRRAGPASPSLPCCPSLILGGQENWSRVTSSGTLPGPF